MIATVNASIANAPATTSAMAAASEVSAGRVNPQMSIQQWVGTNDDALCCCCMNMLSAGRAKIAECGSGQLLAHGERAFARQERAARQEGAAAKTSCVASLPRIVLGESDFPASVASFNSTSR